VCSVGSLLKGHSEFSDSPILDSPILPVFLDHLWVCALGLGIYLYQFGSGSSTQGLLASIRFLAYFGLLAYLHISLLCGSISLLCGSISLLCGSIRLLCGSIRLLCISIRLLAYLYIRFLCISIRLLACFAIGVLAYFGFWVRVLWVVGCGLWVLGAAVWRGRWIAAAHRPREVDRLDWCDR
jgi:hypothetical protein